jgi:type II secretory pathway pseudopilin PulG
MSKNKYIVPHKIALCTTGVTLIELLLYMALLSMLLISILQAAFLLTGDVQKQQRSTNDALYSLMAFENIKNKRTYAYIDMFGSDSSSTFRIATSTFTTDSARGTTIHVMYKNKFYIFLRDILSI